MLMPRRVVTFGAAGASGQMDGSFLLRSPTTYIHRARERERERKGCRIST